MAVPNPYFVNISLQWRGGRPANKNEIARVRAFDSHDGNVTWESECGYDDATGGWKPAYMQHIDAFASRGSPDLYFEVWSTAEELLYTTPIQPSVLCGQLITIIIDESCTPGDDTWVVYGHVTLIDNAPVPNVQVTAYDLTQNERKQLGLVATTQSNGAYSIAFKTTDFSSNGTSHDSPNLVLVVSDGQGNDLLVETISYKVSRNQYIALTLQDQTQPGEYRVYGTVYNALGLPVQNIAVDAYHLTWTANGPREILLGAKTWSRADGGYEIPYSPPKEATETGSCSSVGQINLLVYAFEETTDSSGNAVRTVLDSEGVIFDAAKEQRADLFVDKVAASSDSEYKRIYDRLVQCFGSTEEAWWNSINAFIGRPEYLTFLAKSTGFTETQIAALGRAWTVAGEVDNWTREIKDSSGTVTRPELAVQKLKLPRNGSPIPSSPEILYGLIRPGLGDTLTKLLQIRPDTLFNAWIESAQKKLVSSDVEKNIGTILEDWKLLIGRVLGATTADPNYWQAQLIALAMPDATQATREAVGAATFDYPGSLEQLCAELEPRGDFDEYDTASLLFTFAFYDAVGQFFDITQRVVKDNLTQSPQKWATIADLSRLTLNDWYNLIFEHPDTDGNGTPDEDEKVAHAPPDVPGTTPEERAQIYAARLYAQFTAASPATRYQADYEAATASLPETDPSKEASDFLRDHPDFDLQRSNIDTNIEGWKPADRPSDAAIAEIKKVQRLYRLTADYAAAAALASATPPYDSAISIAQQDEDEFVVKNEQVLGGITKARNIHRTATYYANEVLFTVIKYNQNVNATGGATAVTAAVNLTTLATKSPLDGYRSGIATDVPGTGTTTLRFPNWITLFGDLNKCACQQCQTVLSPGAYLVDILQFVEKTFGQGLFDRRPDIADIEITCANTNRMLPYIDLVNEVLENVVATNTGHDSDFPLTIAQESAPARILTDAELDPATEGSVAEYALVVQSIAEHGYMLGDRAIIKPGLSYPSPKDYIVEDDAWHYRLNPGAAGAAYTVVPYAQTSATNDALEVFPEHYNPQAYLELAQAIFPFNLPLVIGKEETAIFLKQRNVHRHEIREAFTTKSMNAKLLEPDGAEAYLNLTHDEVEVILKQVTGRSHSEYWGFEVPDATPNQPVQIPRPDKPTLWIEGTWINLLSIVPVFMHRARVTYQELLDLLDTEFVHVEVPGDETLRIVCTADDLVECNYNNYQIANLDNAALGRLSFFLRLWRKVGWTMRELDRYLMEMENGQIPGDLVRLALVKRLTEELELPLLTVIAFFRPIDTRRSERCRRSLFDEVFLIGSPAQPEYRALERLGVHGDPIDLDPVNLTEGEDYPSHIRAALRVKSKDFESLWTRFVDVAAPLDLERLTNLYRTAALGNQLKLNVTELDEMLVLTGLDPLPDGFIAEALLTDAIIETFAAIREIRHAQTLRLPVAETNYYLAHVAKLGAKFLPTSDDRSNLLKRLAAASAEIAAAIPKANTPTAEDLASALGRIMPADKVVQAVTAITDTPVLTAVPVRMTKPNPVTPAYLQNEANCDAWDVLARYLPAFVTEDISTFLLALFQIPPTVPAIRYAFVFAPLRTFLKNQVTCNSALTVATELSGLDRDTTDLLLTEALGSAAGRTNAFEDWKLFVTGGWTATSSTTGATESGSRSAYVVIPKDGNYRLALTISSPTTTLPRLEVAGEGMTPPTPIIDTEAGTSRYELPTRLLKAGTALSIAFDYTATVVSGSTSAVLTLGWYVDNADLAPIAESALVPYDERAYLKLFKAAGLLKLLRPTKDETRFLLTGRSGVDRLDLNALPLAPGETAVDWMRLTNLTSLLRLNRSVALESRSLFELMSDPESLDVSDVALELDCRVDDINTVLGLWPVATPPDLKSPEFWYALNACRGIALRLDLRIEQVAALLLDPNPTPAVANTLRNVYRSRFTKDTWKDAFKPHRDKLRQRQRDALVGYLTNTPLGPSKNVHFFDANDLFSHYLIDVEMEPDTLISRLKLALNVVQLFVERIFLGLEPDTARFDLGKARELWAWMRSYRVWEANRKVFLYPENWLEPELRDDKSEIFKEFEEELLADEISNDRGKVALTNYLEKLAEISNLEVVGAYAQSIANAPYTTLLHVVGRSRYQPRAYYYRAFQGKQAYDGDWTPWRKITLEINADVVAPAVFNGRLYLFWLMVQTKQKANLYPNAEEAAATSEPEVTGKNIYNDRAEYQSEIRLMWSEYLAAEKKWLKPRVSKDHLMDYEVQRTPERDIGKDTAETKCYHLRIDEAGSEFISIALIKTKEPDDSGKLSPKQLGAFALRYNGHDSFNGVQQDLYLGANWPIGTVLRHNAAEEVPQLVEGEIGNERLKFLSSAPFLERTPETIRVFQTNFGYLEKAQYKPFFWDTPTKGFFALNRGEVTQGATTREALQKVRFQTFHNPQIREIQSRFQAGGPASIMDRLVQALPVSENYYYNYYNFRSNYYYNYYGNLYLGYHIAGDSMAWGTTQRKFEIEYLPRTDSLEPAYPLPTVEFGYGTPFGLYNWELFFHAPLMIADRLSHDLKFEEAMNWYHYVFDPKQELNFYERTKRWVDYLPKGCRYWNFLPFFANKSANDSLMDVLGLRKTLSAYERADLSSLIDEWRRSPFNPHLIARQRIVAYQKRVVMGYLDNLIAWGDQQFRLDTFESINRATQLYVLAAELLGQRPERVESPIRESRYTYTELKRQKLDAFANAMVDVEYMIVGNQDHVKTTTLPAQTAATVHIKNLGFQTAYFKVPRNDRLDTYWDTVADRLFKIRNSMNIDGIKRQLALFEPPIDPALLVRAAAAGLDLSSVLAQLNTPLPYYRFNIWLQKAVDLCNEVKSFGGALLSALEKKDAEALQMLRQGHEIRMLELARRVRQRQIDEADQNIVALERSRAMAEERLDFYKTREKVSGTEQTQIRQTELAADFELAQGVLHSLSAVFAVIPDIVTGIVGFLPHADVDFNVGTALVNATNAAAAIVGTVAGYHRAEANMAGINAGHERRWDDWQFQLRLAQKEIDQIDQQIIAATIRRQIAEMELSNHEVQMENAEEVRTFLQDKFTNQELYQEMIRKLSTTYQSVYRLAYDQAKTAERTFQFELGVDNPGFIQFNYMASLKMGLLAGEQLIQDLKRMDIAYLERNKREFEIQKSISLATINAQALQDLRDTGKCDFELPEMLFDLDFPGQYFRRIKAVRVTIPCVTGPHTSVSAKLSLLSSAIRTQSTASEVGKEYLYKGYDDSRFVHDLIGIQSIATSSAQNDAGLFELNFRDERYLPFEGGGVISRWHLELPTKTRQFDYSTISDVVLHLSYTARDAGGTMKVGAENAIAEALADAAFAVIRDNPQGLVRIFSLRKEFPDVLHQLLAPPVAPETEIDNTAIMKILPEHFPYVLRYAGASLSNADGSGLLGVYVHTKQGAGGVTLSLTLGVDGPGDSDHDAVPFSGPQNPEDSRVLTGALPGLDGPILEDWMERDWYLTLKSDDATTANLAAVDDILLVLRFNAALVIEP